ncbi:MAG: hypothetical protein AB1490_22235 [Pseudomonadota bacterium]
MSFRPNSKVLTIFVLLGAVLAGCSDYYYDRRDTISVVSGEAMAANRVTHMIDPWPAASGRREIAYSGERMQAAHERYRTGCITKPVNAMTSSSGYAQEAQQTQCQSSRNTTSTPVQQQQVK